MSISLRPAAVAFATLTALTASALVGISPAVADGGACPTLVQGTDFSTFEHLSDAFNTHKSCDSGTMTVSFNTDFTWTENNYITWNGTAPLLLQGTGTNTPTITGMNARVVDNNSPAGVTVSNLTLQKGPGNSQAIYGDSGNVTLIGATVLGTGANDNGIGVRAYNGDVIVTDSTISGNNTGSGAGIKVTGSHNVTVTNSTISNNAATFQGGGGIYAETGTVTLLNSTLSGNSSASDGGGIYMSGPGSVVVTNSTISGNTAAVEGAGINTYGSLSVVNSTISGNAATNADSRGGGLLGHGSSWDLRFATLADNSAGTGGGSNLADADGSTSFTSVGSVIKAENSCAGVTPTATSTYNATLTGDTSCGFGQSGGVGNFSATTDALNLGALAVNANPSGARTMLPTAPSALIGVVPNAVGQTAIGPNATDERGVTRTGSFWVGAAQQGAPAKLSQTPLNNCVNASVRVPREGVRRLMKPNCVTNAGQKVRVRVTGRTPRGDVKYFTVYRKSNGATMIRTYGTKLRLKITWSAAATGNYSAYAKGRVQTT